jgi:hypothetical protein
MSTKPEMSLISKLLREKCDYPECGCGRKSERWAKRFVAWEKEPPSAEELEAAQVDIFVMLNCMSEHASARRVRSHAMVQLLNPVFDKARDPNWPASF